MMEKPINPLDELGEKSTLERTSMEPDLWHKKMLSELGSTVRPQTPNARYLGSFVTHVYFNDGDFAKNAYFLHDCNFNNISYPFTDPPSPGLLQRLANQGVKELARHLMRYTGLKAPSTRDPRVKDNVKD